MMLYKTQKRHADIHIFFFLKIKYEVRRILNSVFPLLAK